MVIGLTDSFGRIHRYLRVSLTDQCNFRCRYCMPEHGINWLPSHDLLSDSEVIRMIRIFGGLGINKVRFTGGEPTLRPNLETLIAESKSIPGIEVVALTTNGTTLKRRAREYRSAGLDIINISLDSLQKGTFRDITLRDQLKNVLAGIEEALQAGIQEVKVNVVVMRGVNENEILDFVLLTQNWPLTVRFIEFMPFVGNKWSQASLIPYSEIRSAIEAKHDLIPIQNSPSSVGKDFFIPGYAGKIGFVTSMTETFCGDCDRIRLTADGAIKPCLFSPVEVNVRALLREGADEETIVEKIEEAIQRKPREHKPMIHLSTIQERSMIQIGG
ncbi:MAG: GTP 3',8-cyclase MoaA [Fimbriimonadaceae bacterium]